VKQYNTWLADKSAAMEGVDGDSTDAKSEPERPDPYQKPTGPIGHAMRTIKNFTPSASDWTTDHLAYFQVIVLNDQLASNLFGTAFILRDDDPTMVALRNEGFCTTQKRSITHGQWDTTRQYNPVFLSLMLLSRGGKRTPSPRTSPATRIDLPCESKNVALTTISEVVDETSPLSRVTTTDSTVSMFSSDRMSVIKDLGPRETLSFTLIHNLLTYLCTMEHRARPDRPQWINWYTLIQ
jgi:hypothetical protein